MSNNIVGDNSGTISLPFGNLLIYKAATNLDNCVLEIGDIVKGQLNNSIFLHRGEYIGGNKLELSSYTNTEFFNPNS